MTEQPTTYARVDYVPPQAMDDAPRLEAMLADFRREGVAKAAAEGYRLSEDFTVQQKPTVWVEDWSEFGGAYVAPEVAEVVGVVGDAAKPGPVMVLHEWQIIG